ncbi:hypothetical protein B0H66DRAFT_445495, partial [Apodospora peruviana]
IFATFTAVLGVVSAKCYGSGDAWQDKDLARSNAQRAREGYNGNAGAFQGEYKPAEVKSLRVQGTGTQRFDFSVRNLNSGESHDIVDAVYTFHHENEINGYDMGGSS